MQKVRTFAFFFLLVTIAQSGFAQKKTIWRNWETVQLLNKTEKRPILVDIYTNWCYYCKQMQIHTYKKDSVSNYLNSKFYCTKFNAESKDSMEWNHQIFRYNPLYKISDWVIYLTKGNVVYPTTVIIPENGTPYYIQGELLPAQLEPILKYFAEGWDKKMSMDDFEKKYTAKWN